MPQTLIDWDGGGWQKFEVPNGVKVLTLTIEGGGSGASQGGYVHGKVRVDPSDVLYIFVGRQGRDSVGTTGGAAAEGGGGTGGNGRGTGLGGRGGGGATQVRKNKRDGRLIAVAGGAGGEGGGPDNPGGAGGAQVGAGGAVGSDGPEPAEESTGGTQAQSGQGGTSSLGSGLWGSDGTAGRLARGGKGGTDPTGANAHGGGGGGGGYYPGGGGAAGRVGVAPAGGGGGGSNYVGGLYTYTNLRGEGGTGHGSVLIEWIDPNAPNQPPVPPTNITIDGKKIRSGLATKAKTKVTVKGTPKDPDHQQGVRMYLRISRTPQFTNFRVERGTYDEAQERDVAVIDRLVQDTRYYLRIHTQDKGGKISPNYRATSFWTNRSPNPPTLISPAENAQFTSLVNVTFEWDHTDPDPKDSQTAYKLRWRKAQTPSTEPGEWTEVSQVVSTQMRVVTAGEFLGNTLYEWQVKTRDEQNRWGDWSDTQSFFVTAESTSPVLVEPIHNAAVVAAGVTEFRWQFRTPDPSTTQVRADLRYRAVGAADWITLTGTITTPGSDWLWSVSPETFEVGFRYEWQVRTYGSGDAAPSDWSESGYFWGTAAPDSGPGVVAVPSGRPASALGQGNNRVFVFQRGGTVMLGEITPTSMIRWTRKRDDMSHALVQINAWDSEGRAFLGSLRTWQMELVIFRDGVRVFEGPIARISSSTGFMEIEAKCPIGYLYRRVMRQGYNDSYRVMNGQQLGQKTVVQRAAQIVMNAFAYDDPNILPYLTPYHAANDATTSRIVNDFSRGAWEEIDDLAANAGLDYVSSGRRILLWDTHQPLGRLPEMRDGDFSEPPIITEYGMSAANFFAVTNNDSVYGYATAGLDADGQPGPEGWIEQLASAYGEAEAPAVARELTREDRTRLAETLTEQAKRNIEGRWPPPIVVRVPDNATLNPDLNVGINQLVPGVWIPLRATTTLRELSQWQKLDSIEVNQTREGEKISVVMSPAPNGGLDPDAEQLQEEL